MNFTPNFTRQEWKTGMIAMTLSTVILPMLLGLVLYGPFNAAQINFLSYFIAAAVAVYVLRRFLRKNLLVALQYPFHIFYQACLGYLAQMGLSTLVRLAIHALSSDFVNLNDQSVGTMMVGDPRLMIMTVTILAPIVEECLYRGLLFRGVYAQSPTAAWILSVGLFSAIHVVGFLGVYSPLALLLSLIQYLPAGFVLSTTYKKTGTIIGPMLVHAMINATAVYATLR